MDILRDCDDEYYSYIDKNYVEINYFSNITLMRKLTDKDIANHIKEINNDVTCVTFEKNYTYQHLSMVHPRFDKIFQVMLNADPSCTFPLYHYCDFDRYQEFSSCEEDFMWAIEQIKMTADPYIDLSTLHDMIGDCLVSSLTTKGLTSICS